MPYNVPPEQWSPEYAAQIMRIMQQGYAQNPDIPQTPAPSALVPMGAPGSLTPPMPPMTPEMQGSRPSFAGTGPTPQAGAQAVAPAGGSVSAPSQGSGTVGTLPGVGANWQAALPMIAAMAYGQNRDTRHMAPLALQMGQMQQQAMGQQQLAHVQSNFAKITQEKGIDAAKKYLTEVMSNPQLSPVVANKVSEKLSEVSQQVNTREAVKKLTTGDPKNIMESLPTIYENLPADVANSLVKTLKTDNKVQFIQVGDQVLAGNKDTAEVREVFKATPQFKLATIGGDDVTQELVRMGLNPTEIGTKAQSGDKDAQGILQQAAERIRQDRLDKEERAAARAGQREGALAAALKAGMVQSSRNVADIMTKPLEQERAKNVSGLLDVEDNLSRLMNEFTPEERARYVGMGGLKMNYQQALQAVQGGRADPKFARFNALVNYAKSEAFKTGGKALTSSEQSIIFGYIPTGEEWSPPQFEQKLKLGWERIGGAIDREVSLGTTAPGGLGEYVEQERTRRKQMKEVPTDTGPSAGGAEWQTDPGTGLRYRIE